MTKLVRFRGGRTAPRWILLAIAISFVGLVLVIAHIGVASTVVGALMIVIGLATLAMVVRRRG